MNALLLLLAGSAMIAPICVQSAPPNTSVAAPVTDRIAVTVTGHGPDLILVPGLASSAHVWDATVAHLAATHRVHVVQVAGFAGMPAGANKDRPVLEPVVQGLHDYIAFHRLTGAPVVGHSFGGTVAMRLAVSHPGDAGRILIVDSLPFLGMMFGAHMTVDMVRPQATLLRDQMIAATQEEFAAGQQMQMARLVKSKGAAIDAAIAAAAASDRRVVAQAFYENMTLDLRPDLAKISVPVTVLYPWDEASGVPQQMFDMLYTSAFTPLPHGKVERVDGSYHFIMVDQPAMFLQKLDAFLAG